MRKRLPLLGPAAAAGAAPQANETWPEQSLGPASIGLADTEDGLAAAGFAVELAVALHALGTPVSLVMLGFQGVPALPPALRKKLDVSGFALTAHAINPAAPRVPVAAHAPDAVTLWVGIPALASFVPALAILLAADRPLTSWPAALRARRGRFQLELSGPRAGLAEALARALVAQGFLPRR